MTDSGRELQQAEDSQGWVGGVPKKDLNTLHHALRLSAKYPGMSTDERDELTRLADVCWNEHCKRLEPLMRARALDRITTPDSDNEPPDFQVDDGFGI